ncbi:hypothetical protein MRO89_22025 [Dickeya dianthicola]|uniref:hypothetical protein n=1 Tax=Dickeya dianthicola TaxID=204039 RepID=UPI001F60D93F|nr:hypothetical protein [Dickeya dianthicola]MCI4188587.1 hypothetical protein [Dickeya dianthicola]
MKKINNLSNEQLKETFSSIEEVIVVFDKITSGFDDHEKMALALLLFFSESDILERLMKIRRLVNSKLIEELSKSEYDEWSEKEVNHWPPPYEKTKKELLEMQDKDLIWTKHP